jgi:LysR family transcriptional activator of mexEF-oprN operon
MNFEFSETDLRRLDLNLLLVLTALMRERSVRRAAARLFVGPPAISMALRRLRDLTGDPMFVRGSRGMEPTPRALALYERVAPLLQGVHEAVFQPPAFDPAGIRRTIRFASPDDFEFLLVPRLLQLLQAEAPGVTLVLRSTDFTAVADTLASGDADVVLSASLRDLGDAVPSRLLYSDGFEILFDPARIGAAEIPLDRYLALPHLLFSPRGDSWGLIDDALARIGARRRVIATLVRFTTLPFVLKEIAAIGTVPRLMARMHAARFGLATQPLPFDAPSFEVALFWAARLRADPAILWFVDRVQSLVADLRREAGHDDTDGNNRDAAALP